MPRAVLTSKKSQDEAGTRAALRWLLQTDLYSLAFLLNKDRGEYNQLDREVHGDLCRFMAATPYQQNLYLLSRGYFKTSVITVARNVQRILNHPNIRILLASNKSENAEAMLVDIKTALTQPNLLWAFPDILWPDPARQAEKWTTTQIVVRRPRRFRESTVEAIGVSGELTSRHYDHGTFDDIVGKENSTTREELMKVIQFIKLAQPLIDPVTSWGALSTQDYIGTTWHYADAWAWLLEQKAKHGKALGVYRMPIAVPDPEHGEELPGYGPMRPTFPTRFPMKKIIEIRADMGWPDFAAQCMLDPVSADTAYFPREKARIIPRKEVPPLDTLWIVMTVDPAISTKAWADYSAIAVAGFAPEGGQYLLDLRRGRWKETELVAQIFDAFARTPGIRAIGFEAIGFAKIFRRLLTAEGEARGQFLPIVALERDTNITKRARQRALEPVWSARELILVDDVPALEDFLDEAARWRPDRENAHDDMIDAVVDTLQLRVRPQQESGTNLAAWEDPEVLARLEFERELIADRARAGGPALDRGSLRMAYSHARWHEQAEADRAALVGAGASPIGEFF